MFSCLFDSFVRSVVGVHHQFFWYDGEWTSHHNLSLVELLCAMQRHGQQQQQCILYANVHEYSVFCMSSYVCITAHIYVRVEHDWWRRAGTNAAALKHFMESGWVKKGTNDWNGVNERAHECASIHTDFTSHIGLVPSFTLSRSFSISLVHELKTMEGWSYSHSSLNRRQGMPTTAVVFWMDDDDFVFFFLLFICIVCTILLFSYCAPCLGACKCTWICSTVLFHAIVFTHGTSLVYSDGIFAYIKILCRQIISFFFEYVCGAVCSVPLSPFSPSAPKCDVMLVALWKRFFPNIIMRKLLIVVGEWFDSDHAHCVCGMTIAI